ncbi:hypothetical protein BGZ82_001195 [Podila clonocystis]|nr:hypothetical protein BGZ82_001195 [Podila clonocystis]
MSLFCLVDGEATPFTVEVDRTKTVDHLKDLIKAKKANDFSDIDADKLTLWRVSILDDDDDDENLPILLGNIPGKDRKKLKAAHELSDLFNEKPAKRTIHIIDQHPPPVIHLFLATFRIKLLVLARRYLASDLRVDIKKITDKFFSHLDHQLPPFSTRL